MFSKKLTETQMRDIARNEARRIVGNAFEALKNNAETKIELSFDSKISRRDLHEAIELTEDSVRRGLCG